VRQVQMGVAHLMAADACIGDGGHDEPESLGLVCGFMSAYLGFAAISSPPL
jgi:hypothetical protein